MYGSEFMAYDHCLYQMKSSNVDWIFTLHAMDAYLRVPPKDSLFDLLSRQSADVLFVAVNSAKFYECEVTNNSNGSTTSSTTVAFHQSDSDTNTIKSKNLLPPTRFGCRDKNLGPARTLGEPIMRTSHTLYNDRHAGKARHPGRWKHLGLAPDGWRVCCLAKKIILK